ncbi:hypothetical protein D3C81_2021040 [compost metagenome]
MTIELYRPVFFARQITLERRQHPQFKTIGAVLLQVLAHLLLQQSGEQFLCYGHLHFRSLTAAMLTTIHVAGVSHLIKRERVQASYEQATECRVHGGVGRIAALR